MENHVTAVVPAYNEKGKIGRVVTRLMSCGFVQQVIVVDDGSSDGTTQEAKTAGADVLKQPANQGVGAALRAGFAKARQNGADIIVVLGGDDQDNPEEISRLLEPIRQGYDFVQGSRWMAGGRTENIPLFRRVTTQVYSLLFKLCTGFRCTDGTNGFRAFRASLLDHISLDAAWLNTYELEPYLFYHAARRFKATEVPVTKRYPADRQIGYSKMTPFRDWWRILRPLVFLTLGLRR